MRFVISVILIIAIVKCGKAMYIEFREGSPWGWMWLIFGVAALWGLIASLP